MRYNLPREVRIRKKKEFEAVYNGGRKFSHQLFIAFYLKNSYGYSRLGLTVSKKIGNAVVRNRVKRLIREVFRLNRHELKGNYDIVFNVKKGISNSSFDDVESAFMDLVDFLEKND